MYFEGPSSNVKQREPLIGQEENTPRESYQGFSTVSYQSGILKLGVDELVLVEVDDVEEEDEDEDEVLVDELDEDEEELEVVLDDELDEELKLNEEVDELDEEEEPPPIGKVETVPSPNSQIGHAPEQTVFDNTIDPSLLSLIHFPPFAFKSIEFISALLQL